MGLPILGLGIWYALARGRRWPGALIALAGLAWSFFAVYVVVGHFRSDGSVYYGFYDEVGGSPQGVVRMLFTDPGVALGALFEAHDIVYVIWLGLPLLFLFLLSPALAAVALPQLLANGLSDFRSMTDPRYHSVAAVVPFLFAATVFGIARLPVQRRTLAAGGVLACSLVLDRRARPVGAPRRRNAAGWSRRCPLRSRSGAGRCSCAHPRRRSRHRVEQRRWPSLGAAVHVHGADSSAGLTWVVVDRADPWVVTRDSPILTNHPERVRAFVARLESDGWQMVFDRSGVVVLRRDAR